MYKTLWVAYKTKQKSADVVSDRQQEFLSEKYYLLSF